MSADQVSDDQHMNSRRKVLKSTLRGAGLLGLGGTVWGTTADKLKVSEIEMVISKEHAAVVEDV